MIHFSLKKSRLIKLFKVYKNRNKISKLKLTAYSFLNTLYHSNEKRLVINLRQVSNIYHSNKKF